jgi:ABC-2 type transport system ATP-binding protein
LGNVARATIRGSFGAAERDRAAALGLDLTPASLQELVVRMTGSSSGAESRTGTRPRTGTDRTAPKETIR